MPPSAFPPLQHNSGSIQIVHGHLILLTLISVCMTISKHTLRSPSRTPSIPPHRHSLLLLNNIVQVCQRALELPAIDRLGRLAGVFEGNAEVGAAGARGLGGLDLGGCVADLESRRGLLADLTKVVGSWGGRCV